MPLELIILFRAKLCFNRGVNILLKNQINRSEKAKKDIV
jgi:hypothetical protein